MFGNHLFSIGRNGGSIKAVDVRAPASPVVMSVLPISSTYFFGSTTLEPYVAKPYHRGLVVRGTRLYETGYDEVRIIELE